MAQGIYRHYLKLDKPVLGRKHDHHFVFWVLLFGFRKPHAGFWQAARHVDHDVDQPNSRRKRLCRICVQRVSVRDSADQYRGCTRVYLAIDQLLPLSVHWRDPCAALDT